MQFGWPPQAMCPPLHQPVLVPLVGFSHLSCRCTTSGGSVLREAVAHLSRNQPLTPPNPPPKKNLIPQAISAQFSPRWCIPKSRGFSLYTTLAWWVVYTKTAVLPVFLVYTTCLWTWNLGGVYQNPVFLVYTTLWFWVVYTKTRGFLVYTTSAFK